MSLTGRDFEPWLVRQFARRGSFTVLIILIAIREPTLFPIGASYASVIGNEMSWPEMRRLLDASGLKWDGAALFVAESPDGKPLIDAEAKAQLHAMQERIIADHARINEGAFFDRKGRLMRVEEIETS
ncbi:MAG: hypothetical protein HYR63_17120 [Proteobacteria bacterium]|nr:hypothetical protein [Pseudomonadota bacterium]MBI3499955.1 hypothetical protein [Pseudomonadota bacterium]